MSQPRVGNRDSNWNASSHGVFGLSGQESSQEKHRLDQEVANRYVFNHVLILTIGDKYQYFTE